MTIIECHSLHLVLEAHFGGVIYRYYDILEHLPRVTQRNDSLKITLELSSSHKYLMIVC